MPDDELIKLAERCAQGLKSEFGRMQARANHRKSAGRKLSAADTEHIDQLENMRSDVLAAIEGLLSMGQEPQRIALRHRLREQALLNL